MEVKMKNNNINSILIIIIFLLTIIPVLINIKKEHDDKVWLVFEKEVVESATTCQRENKCPDKEATIAFLINNGYLEKAVNPLTKEVISNDSYVDLENYQFIIKE